MEHAARGARSPRSTQRTEHAAHKARNSRSTQCTEHELFVTLSDVCGNATMRTLSKYSEEDLQDMGVLKRRVPMLDWTYANMLSFHRSPLVSEVLETAQASSGMRAFIAIFNYHKERDNDDLRVVEEKTARGHPITINIRMPDFSRSQGTSSLMGEDVVM